MPPAKQPSTPLIFLGIDPGETGGIAVLCGAAVSAITMPRTDRYIWDYIASIVSSSPGNVVAGMEQVGGYVKKNVGPPCRLCKQSRNTQPASSAFNFGDGNGAIRMAMIGNGLSVTKAGTSRGELYMIPPREWQSGLRIDQRRKGESDTDWKSRLFHNAERLFPKDKHRNLTLTRRTSDALLIALYTKRHYTGTLLSE